VSDSIYDKMKQVSAKEIADAIDNKNQLSVNQKAAADVNGDGRIDESDVEMLAEAQLQLANKISGVIVGMGELTPEERAVAERNGDGYVNLTDGQRLADDARKAKLAAARIKRAKTGELKQ
jgi:hypothetical protein